MRLFSWVFLREFKKGFLRAQSGCEEDLYQGEHRDLSRELYPAEPEGSEERAAAAFEGERRHLHGIDLMTERELFGGSATFVFRRQASRLERQRIAKGERGVRMIFGRR